MFSLEELSLALKRVERDHQYSRVFVSRPTEWIVLRADRAKWLERLHASLSGGLYVPSPAQVADVPKGKGAVRAACLLTLVDEVVFTAAVGRLLPAIQAAIAWGDPPPDLSYLVRNPLGTEWLSNPFLCATKWRERSVAALEAHVHFVVATDITGYYDAVLHEVLLSDLLSAGAEADVARFLAGKMLSRWAMVNGRGIPQGLSASDLLAKLYLNTVDRTLAGAGVVHLRYVDDFRMFCRSGADARRALLALQSLLRLRGLAIQSAKTAVLRPDRAKAQFEGIQPVLAPLAKKFIASIAAAAGLSSDYLPPSEAAKVLATLKAPPTDLLREAYAAYLMAEGSEFDKTLFRYLLGQLGRAKDPFATEHSLQVLAEHPQETATVLAYLARTASTGATEASVLALLTAPEAIYPYQHYQYLQWRVTQADTPTEAVQKYARDIITAPRSPAYLVAAARLLLGRFGSHADHEQIKAQYAAAEGEGARLDIVCCLYRMEEMQRNAFLGQVRGDGVMVEAAVAAVKTGKVQLGLETL